MAPADGESQAAARADAVSRPEQLVCSGTGVATPPTSGSVVSISPGDCDALSEWMPTPRAGTNSPQMPSISVGVDSGVEAAKPGIDLEKWREDLGRLHGTIDQVVQSFISGQTRQLDAVAAELSSQKARIQNKEQRFTELSDSIAGFVEEEARRLEACGLQLSDAGVDAQREAYDAGLPGPPALHRINRLWRKATRAFESSREAASRERAEALEEQRVSHEAAAAEAAKRCEAERGALVAELATLREQLQAVRGEAGERDGAAEALAAEVKMLNMRLAETAQEAGGVSERLAQLETSKQRSEYEWSAEREELERLRSEAQAQAEALERDVAAARVREADLERKCAERSEKVEQMKKVMDDQEIEMTTKIDRVQQYVKERQVGALHAEKKQQDAEKMAERWQAEVKRLQADRDKLAQLVLELETSKSDQGRHIKGVQDLHTQEVSNLQSQLRRREEEMRAANLELLQKREEEYVAKVSLEKQREKDRSSVFLRKKEQEVQIKDQQLRAAKQRLRELGGDDQDYCSSAAASAAASPRQGRDNGVRRPASGEKSLPPLPLSAR